MTTPLDPIRSKRVPRFVEEYAKDRIGARAAMRAGFTQNPDSAASIASRLLSDVKVQELVAEEMERVSREANVEAAFVLREWLALATADPSKIVKARRLNCRYCNGIGHEYQWTAREYAQACDNATKRAEKEKQPVEYPECVGGFGWVFNAEPNPHCPECHGEGKPDIFICDTEALTGPERKLIAGIKQTRDGIEIKMRDQDGAVKLLAQYLGMLVERREVRTTDVSDALKEIAGKLPV